MNRRDVLTSFAATVGAIALAPSVAAAAAAPERDATAEADRWAQGYLVGYGQGLGNGETAGFHDGWDAGERTGYASAEQQAAPTAVVVGALYDFMGRLTTLDEPLTVSRGHTVYALLEAFQAWAEERGLDIRAADVARWQERLEHG